MVDFVLGLIALAIISGLAIGALVIIIAIGLFIKEWFSYRRMR